MQEYDKSIRNAMQNKNKNTKLDKIKNTIKELSDNLEDSSAYSPFITFKVGKGVGKKDSEDYTMQFDTLSGLGKSGDKNNDSHYILQAEVKKYGLNMANAFKVRIAFVADYANDKYGDGEYLSLNDKIKHNNTVFQKFDQSILFQDCELRYGYTFNVNGVIKYLLTPTYRGTIIKYSMEILNGYVMYDLECVSGLCKFVESTVTKSSSELYELAENTYNPIKMLVGLLREYIEANDLNYDVIDNINENGGPGCEVDGGNGKGKKVIFNKDGVPNGKHILEYVREVLPKCRAKGQWNYYLKSQYTEEEIQKDIAKNKKHKYVSDEEYIEFFFTVEDDVENGENPRIVFDYKPKTNQNEYYDLINFNFEWLSGDKKGLIMNFLPDFNGALYFGYMGGLQSIIKNTMEKIIGARYYCYTIDNNGGMEKVEKQNESFNNPITYALIHSGESVFAGLSDLILDTTSSRNTLTESIGETADNLYNVNKLDNVDEIISGLVANPDMADLIAMFGTTEGLASAVTTAKLQLVGIPTSIPLTTKIKITPIVNNRKHFTSGNYIITGISDSISQAGYITNFDLFKEPSEDGYEDLVLQYIEKHESDKYTQKEINWAFNDGENIHYYEENKNTLTGDYGLPSELLNGS